MFLITLLLCSVKCCGAEAQPDNSKKIANMRVIGFDTWFILVFQFNLSNMIIVLSTNSCLENNIKKFDLAYPRSSSVSLFGS